MKRDTLIICAVIVLCALALAVQQRQQNEQVPQQIHQGWQAIEAERQQQLDAQRAARMAADEAAWQARKRADKARQDARDEAEFQDALKHIPADVEEPRRSVAARELVRLNREHEDATSKMDRRVRDALRDAGGTP